jgi:hypothetical protein
MASEMTGEELLWLPPEPLEAGLETEEAPLEDPPATLVDAAVVPVELLLVEGEPAELVVAAVELLAEALVLEATLVPPLELLPAPGVSPATTAHIPQAVRSRLTWPTWR